MATQSRWTITPPTQERTESRWTITRPQQEADQEAVQERPGFFEGAPTDSSPEELARHQALRAQQEQARTALEGEREAQFVGLVDDPRAPRGVIPNMDILGNGLQGAGWSDEYRGALARLSNVWTPEDERLDPALVAQRERERVSQVREDRPVSTFLAEMGSGAVLTSPLGGSGALRSMSAARPMASAAVGGGAGGAIAGAGEASGGIRDRLMGAASAVPLGVALGPLAVKAGRAVSSVAEAGSRTARAAFDAARGRQGASRGAERMFDDAARRAGFTVDDARSLPQRSPDGFFLGERMGPTGDAVIRAAGNRADSAGDAVAEAVTQRRAGRTQRILDEVRLNTGGRRGVDAIADVRAAEGQAAPHFNRAREQRVPLDDDLRGVLENIQARGISLRAADRARPAGDPSISGMLNFKGGASRDSGQTLNQFIRSRGGLSDDRGDILSAAGSPSRARGLISEGGEQIDYAAEAAFDAGFFPGRGSPPSRTEFLDAVADDLNGRPVRSVQDFNASQDLASRAADMRAIESGEATINLGALHDLAKEVEDEAQSLYARPRGNAAREVSALHRQLRNVLRDASPDFAEGSRIWRSARLDEEARKLGQRALRGGAEPEDALRQFLERDDMSASERGQFLSGVLDAVEGRVESVAADGGNQAGRLGTGTIRRRLEMVFGKDEADTLVELLRREGRQASLERAAMPNEGSATFPRQEADRLLRDIEVGPARSIAADATRNIRQALLQRPRDVMADRLGRGRSEDVEGLARALTGSADQQNPAVAEFIARMEKQQRMREIVDQAMQPVAAVYGAQSSRSR